MIIRYCLIFIVQCYLIRVYIKEWLRILIDRLGKMREHNYCKNFNVPQGDKSMSAAIDIRGLKRICAGCGTRFYDMNKRPIVCPSCGDEFSGEVKVKTRRSKAVEAAEDTKAALAAEAKPEADEDELEEPADTEATEVSLEEAQSVEKSEDEEDTVAPDLDMDAGIGDLDEITADDDDLDDDVDLDADSDKDE